jgi:hypothetical protein
MRMRRTIMAVVTALTILGGCGGDDSKDAGSGTATAEKQVATTTARTEVVTTPAGAEVATIAPVTQVVASESTGEPTEFRANRFVPSFSAKLPPGWFVAQRDVDLAQAYKLCSSCLHEGEENGEITIGKDLSSLPPAEAAAHVVTAQNGTAGPIEPVEVASYPGTHVAITRPGTTELRFTDSGYHTEATGEPVDLYFIDVDGVTLSILVDAHTASGRDAAAFQEAVTEILGSLTFGT